MIQQTTISKTGRAPVHILIFFKVDFLYEFIGQEKKRVVQLPFRPDLFALLVLIHIGCSGT
jgi:hypothetical protein